MNTALRAIHRTLALLLVAGAFYAIAISNSTSEAPRGGWMGFDQVDRSQVPSNIPTWTPALAQEFPGCQANDAETVGYTLVVIKGNGNAVRMPLDEAMRVAETPDRSDDVWVVGVCE